MSDVYITAIMLRMRRHDCLRAFNWHSMRSMVWHLHVSTPRFKVLPGNTISNPADIILGFSFHTTVSRPVPTCMQRSFQVCLLYCDYCMQNEEKNNPSNVAESASETRLIGQSLQACYMMVVQSSLLLLHLYYKRYLSYRVSRRNCSQV